MSSDDLVPRQLTRRQVECVELVAKGLSSKEIARELGISPSTVDNHVAAVMHQYNLPNRTSMVRFLGADQGLLARSWPVDADGDRLVEAQAPQLHLGQAPCGCAFGKLQKYATSSLLPSLLFAAQTAVFIVILLFALRLVFNFAY